MPRESRSGAELTIRRQVEIVGQTSVLVYAGTSPKRTRFLKDTFLPPYFRVEQSPGGHEEETENVLDIARSKVGFVYHRNPRVRHLMRESLKNGIGNMIIGTDLRTNPLQRYSLDSVSRTHSRGKPYDEYGVRKTMSRISRAAQNSDSPPFYRADAGSVLARRNGEIATRENLSIILDPDKIHHFGTVRGFEEYKRVFEEFYRSSLIYEEEKTVPSVTSIAGGLSLGVLLSQDAVLQIGDVPKEDPNWRNAVKMGLYHVLISFSPQILRTIRPDIDQVIQSYAPLEHTTKLAMGEIPLTPRKI